MNLGKSIVHKLIKGYRISIGEEKPLPKKETLPVKVKEETEAKEVKTEKEETKIEGIEIPTAPRIAGIPPLPELPKEKTLTYPLIPRKPERGETVFAYAKIFWDQKSNHYIYQLVEPELTDKLKNILNKVRELLEQRLDVDFSKLKKFEAINYLNKEVDEVLKYFGFVTTEEEKKILKYYVERDFIGLGKIEPFMRDINIEDISCDGVGIPIFVFHRNPNIGSIVTNIAFDNSDELDSFIIRLAQLCGKSVSVAQPLLDGMLPDGSRLQLTLATDIARRGSNFSIRRFTEEPLTPVHILNFGTSDVKTLAYLWFVVDKGMGILVSGGTASGKTSFMNVLSLFIRPEKKIISIEDTGELRLPHSHWVPSVARTAIAEGEKAGEVDLFDLLKMSLRQRPDYTIVGEVRGKEAYILFQQMATGHPSLATIHAENFPKLMDRLTTPPISLPPALIDCVDLIVFLARMYYKNKFVRKVVEVVEIAGFDQKTNSPIVNVVCKWNPVNDKFEFVGSSVLLKRISDLTGMRENEIREEIERRIVVLSWLQRHNISNYVDVYKVFSLYYREPYRLLSMIEGEF